MHSLPSAMCFATTSGLVPRLVGGLGTTPHLHVTTITQTVLGRTVIGETTANSCVTVREGSLHTDNKQLHFAVGHL